MGFEIEKKFLVGSFDATLAMLEKDFGKPKFQSKCGFWFASNFTGFESMFELVEPQILKKDVLLIKEIGEFEIPVQDFRFLRLRIINNNKFQVTCKLKTLVNKIEQNVEYEFDIEKPVFERVFNYLSDKSFIFYYNIKDSYEFKSGNLTIEISKFSDLKDAYLEIELTGKKEEVLIINLKENLKKFKNYSLREEERSYAELSSIENRNILRSQKLSQYSKDAMKEIYNKLAKS